MLARCAIREVPHHVTASLLRKAPGKSFKGFRGVLRPLECTTVRSKSSKGAEKPGSSGLPPLATEEGLKERLDPVSQRTLQLLKRKKVTTKDLQILKRKKKPITMVSAHNYPAAVHVDLAGIDCLLVGDSLGMVELGMDTTLPVDMEIMLHHCKAVARGATRPLLIGDMPFGASEVSKEEALRNAYRFLKEAGMDCVKLEGGRSRVDTVKHLVRGGVAVMGHIGLTPQHISVLGGFRAQGRTATAAEALIEDALALQDAGCFALVLECVPAIVAKAVTDVLDIPTIGIGAGGYTSGQVLVYQDFLGMMQHPHHEQFVPRFCKRYADVGGAIKRGLESFREDVEHRKFPDESFSPYTMPDEEEKEFKKIVREKFVERMKGKAGPEELSEIEKVY